MGATLSWRPDGPNLTACFVGAARVGHVSQDPLVRTWDPAEYRAWCSLPTPSGAITGRVGGTYSSSDAAAARLEAAVNARFAGAGFSLLQDGDAGRTP